MVFTVRNQAKIANKYIRFAKWKIINLSHRFGEVLYSEIYVTRESVKPAIYKAIVKLGVPGPDIVVSAESEELKQLWAQLSVKLKRQVRKYSTKNKS